MDWKDYLNEWGLSLRGLAQGGLHYGEDGEAGQVRYARIREIALQMIDDGDAVTEEALQVWGAELVDMADASLEEGLENPFDLDRYQVVRQLGEKMRALGN